MNRVALRNVFPRFATGRASYKKPFEFFPVAWSFCYSYSVSRAGFDNYESVISSWDLTIPEKFNFASDVIDVWARREKEGTRDASVPALWFVSENGQEKKWNYQQLQSESTRVANMLQEKCNIKRGDNVIVMLPKIAEFWLITLAAIRIGAVTCPSTTMLTANDLSYRLRIFKPICVISHESVTETVEKASAGNPILRTKIVVSNSSKKTDGWLDFHSLQNGIAEDHQLVETKSDESMLIFFTSGTSGYPKMVEHTHGNYSLAQKITGMLWQDLTCRNIHWNLTDTGWAKTAYSGFFGPWWCGSCIFVHGMPRFDPKLILQVLTNYPIDTICAPPTIYRVLSKENLRIYKFSELSLCLSGGDALNAEDIKQWQDGTGLRIYQGYGQSETVVMLANLKCFEFRIGSLGKPVPGAHVVILDENENELGPDAVGEIALKKRQGKIFGLFEGYKNDPEKTKMTITENYYHSGDSGYYDKDGYFWFVGRKDDIINSAGYRIGPFEVESALRDHSEVAEVAVVGSPDKDRGEVVKAFIVLKNEMLSDESKSELIKELQDHCKKITAPYKYPRKIEFVKGLPKTTNGKLKRKELKEMEWRNF